MRAAKAGVLAALALLPAAGAHAEICYSQAYPASQPPLVTTAMRFDCPDTGVRTIAQLAAAGHAIVKLGPVVIAPGQAAQQLIVELQDGIFASGFE